MFPLLPFLLYGGATAGLLWWTAQPSRNGAPAPVGPVIPTGRDVGSGAPPPGAPPPVASPLPRLVPRLPVRVIVPGDLAVASLAGITTFAPFALFRVTAVSPTTVDGELVAYLSTSPISGINLASPTLAGRFAATPGPITVPLANVAFVQLDGSARRFLPRANA